MSSSWDRPGPQRTVVDLHCYVSYWYGFIAALVALAVVIGGRLPNIEEIVILAVLAALCIGHHKTSEAAERNANWVPLASVLLALPLLVSFPIGTYLAVRLFINAPKMNTAEPANEVVKALE